MSDVRVQFLGTGDPFASGGRLQACILVETANGRFLLDCGATALVSMERRGIDPGTIDAVIVSHFHGDHSGGLPLMVLEAVIGARDGATRPPRGRPLLIAGPAGIEDHVRAALELFRWETAFSAALNGGLLSFATLAPGRTAVLGPLSVTAYPVPHTPEALALRISCRGRTIAYSGDTVWSETLVELADGADLFICQAYTFAIPQSTVLNYRTVVEQRSRLRCGKLVLTHIGAEMQSRLAEVTEIVAEDGLVITL
jgi:ribonuclease BN (tRNA processing enzyme)